MDFDFTTETITPDTTAILTIGGTGALEIPSGTTGQEPAGAIAGALRWNTTVPQLEYYNGSAWLPFNGSVTSVAVSGANGIGVSGSPITSTGTIALTLGAITPTSVAATGAVSGTTLTASTLTANSFLYSGTGGLLTTTTAPTNGQLLIGSTGAAPVAAALTAGTGVSVTNGAGSITIANTGVLSFSAGTTGFTPSTATTGAVTLAGTLNVANGGTGLSTAPANGQLLVGNGTTYTLATITAGTAISVTNAAGSITVNNTGVTSLTGTTNQVTASAATGAVTLSLPQNINTTATPTFNQVTITNAPVAGTDTVNLAYLQGVQAGLEWKQEVVVATTADLSAASSTTSTITGTNVVLTIDGQIVSTLGARVLVKNQTTQSQNGIYTLTQAGVAGTTPWILTRAIDANTGPSLNNATTLVTTGTANINTGWTQTTPNPTLGTSNIVFAQFAGGTGNVISFQTSLSGLTPSTATTGAVTLAGTLGFASGGTGLTSTPTNGQIDIGNGAGFTRATITAGTAVSVTNGAGTITIANTGVTSNVAGTGISVSGATGAVTITNTGVTSAVAGTGISVSGATGAVTFSNTGVLSFSAGTTGLTPSTTTTGAVTLAGTLVLANGGTSASLTAVNGGVVYSTATAMAISAAGTTGQVLTSNGAAAPTWASNGGLKLYAESSTSPTAPSATGTNSVAIGTGSAASATDSLGLGLGSSAALFGVQAAANGSFATAGDAQQVHGVLRNITSSNAALELFLDGSGATQRLVLPNNSAWTFTIRVACRRTDATGSIGSWIFNGLIYRDATAATTTIPGGAISKTTVARVGTITATNDPVVTADTTNGSLKVTGTGNTGATFRWVADVTLTQVTN